MRIARSLRLGRALAPLMTLALALTAHDALAQKKKPKTPPAPAPIEEPAPPPPPPAPEPAPTPEPTTAPPADSSMKDEKKDAEPAVDMNDVTELPGKKYYFLGARYRLTVIPQGIVNLFVDEGATFVSHSGGIEFEMRKDGFSLIPALVYTSYGTGGNVLFKEKSKPDVPENYSIVNSSLGAIFVTADLLWSVPISKQFDFEYGAGFGLGWLVGDLRNTWAHQVVAGADGAVKGSNGNYYAACATQNDGRGCPAGQHTNPDPAKVGPDGYIEKNWFSGGSVPALFIHLAIPELGVRYKPWKFFEVRGNIGMTLTGPYIGISGAYGLEHLEKK